MNLLNLQLSALLVLDPLSVILPFLWIFRLEWRYDAHRIAGILFGYLFIICGLFLFFLRLLPGFSRHGLIWSLLLMAFSLSLCLLLTKVKIQAAAYTLFLFKNVSASASLLSRFLTVLITSHNPSIPHTACVRSLELLLIPAAVLIITAVIGTRLRQAVYYTRFLPVWRRMLLIPAFFFLMYYMDMGLIYMPELRPDDYNYNVLLITLFWLICVYTVHITTLQILFLITQSFALKEEYRTMKVVSDALTSQTANLQINLEQLLKARHDFRHHLAILKGLLGQKDGCIRLSGKLPGQPGKLRYIYLLLQRSGQCTVKLLSPDSQRTLGQCNCQCVPSCCSPYAGHGLLHHLGKPALQCPGGLSETGGRNTGYLSHYKLCRPVHDHPVHPQLLFP